MCKCEVICIFINCPDIFIKTFDLPGRWNKYHRINFTISAFARTHAKKQDTVPSGGHTTKSGNSLGDVNQLHQTLKDLSRSKHGVSTRHLPGYLNWISYLKRKKYTGEREKLAEVIFKDLYETEGTVLRDEICKTEQPVSLYEAYHEYHYGIFKDA